MNSFYVCIAVYLVWGAIIGAFNARTFKYPWWTVPIVAVVWFPVAMGLKIKIGPIKLYRGD